MKYLKYLILLVAVSTASAGIVSFQCTNNNTEGVYTARFYTGDANNSVVVDVPFQQSRTVELTTQANNVIGVHELDKDPSWTEYTDPQIVRVEQVVYDGIHAYTRTESISPYTKSEGHLIALLLIIAIIGTIYLAKTW